MNINERMQDFYFEIENPSGGKNLNRDKPTNKGEPPPGQSSLKNQKVDHSESKSFDFTRCERSDGSSYGTEGKCRKGREVAKKYTHEVHADLQRGFSKKAFKEYVDKWDGKIEGETDRGVFVRFPSESYARSFARNLKFDTRIKGVDVSEHDVNAIG